MRSSTRSRMLTSWIFSSPGVPVSGFSSISNQKSTARTSAKKALMWHYWRPWQLWVPRREPEGGRRTRVLPAQRRDHVLPDFHRQPWYTPIARYAVFSDSRMLRAVVSLTSLVRVNHSPIIEKVVSNSTHFFLGICVYHVIRCTVVIFNRGNMII